MAMTPVLWETDDNKKKLSNIKYALIVALMKSHPILSWRANNHSDGSMKQGNWFVAGMHLAPGDISFYLPSSWWFALDYGNIATTNRAPLLNLDINDLDSDTVFYRLFEWSKSIKA